MKSRARVLAFCFAVLGTCHVSNEHLHMLLEADPLMGKDEEH